MRQRRRRPVIVPVAALTVLVGISPVLASGRHAPRPGGDRPVPDVNYEYAQLYQMSTSYLQRYSGEDGPPGDLDAARGNLPPNVNGWQEFFRHWKEQVTSRSVMGRFAADLHVDDHLFRAPSASFFGPPPPYDSDVRTVTIPGATCPGQTVLVAGHPDSTPGTNIANGSAYDDTTGVTMGMAELQAMARWWTKHHTWPVRTLRVALFDAEEEGLFGSLYYASHLIPPGPQGKIVMVANMDQNGMEYPAHPLGTTQSTWGPGFWYTNINATPLKDFRIYRADGRPGPMPAQFRANLPAIRHFRVALAQSVDSAFRTLGAKYHYSIPLEDPVENGRTVAAYRQSDIPKFSPVQDDTLGRTDQVPFIQLGIPGYGVVGAFDSNGTDNPTANPATPLSPLGAGQVPLLGADYGGIPIIAGYDTPRDNIVHLNVMASGTTGGHDGETGSVELRRALELPMTWTLNLISRPEYVGATAPPPGPVAYFEALPTSPDVGTTVRFNGSMTAANSERGLRYAWSFGDGTTATGAVATHRYLRAGWYVARLVVRSADGRTSGYEQTVKVGRPSSSRPRSDACGQVSARAQTAVLSAAFGRAGQAGDARRRRTR